MFFCQLPPPGESNLIDIEGGEGRSQTLAMLEEEQNIQQLEQRELAVRQLEADIMDVNQIFKDLANLVHDQVSLLPLIICLTALAHLRVRLWTPSSQMWRHQPSESARARTSSCRRKDTR